MAHRSFWWVARPVPSDRGYPERYHSADGRRERGAHMDAQAGMLAMLFEHSMGLGPEWRVEDVWFESCV